MFNANSPNEGGNREKYAHMKTHAHKKTVGYQPATLLLSNKGDVWKYAARRF